MVWTAILVLVVAVTVLATTFRSFSGKFAFDIPVGWNQVDYRTADYHMKQIDSSLTFEAVFSDGGSSSVFGDKYLILTVDTVGALNQQGLDSLLSSVQNEFKKKVQRYAGTDEDGYISQKYIDKVAYDTVHNVISIVTTLWDSSVKHRNVLAIKVYDHGVANFYFYSPDSLYEAGLPAFRSILASFTTDVDSKSSSKPVKVANLKRGQETSFTIIFIVIAVALALIVFILLSRRRKKNSK
jgi:hypothetical protein